MLCLGAGLALSVHAASPTIGYAAATGYYKKESRPTLYQPLNLLDGREITAWCTPDGDPLTQKITVGFKGAVKVDEVRIYTGNGADDTSFQEFSRAKKFSIKGGGAARNFTVADQRGLQAVTLKPPLKADVFTVEILDQYPADDLDAPVCVTDIVFYSDGKPLNGPWLTPKLKYDKVKAALLGTWYSGYDGAPERFLSFYFDGTYHFSLEPIDATLNKPRSYSGDFDAGASRVVVDVPGKGKFAAKIKRDKVGDEARRTLSFEGGDKLPEELREPFREKP